MVDIPVPAPYVTYVTSLPCTGTYTTTSTGESIDIYVHFTEGIEVSGSPTLLLNAGGACYCTYVASASGEASGVLNLRYTTASGDYVPGGGLLDYTSTAALSGSVVGVDSGEVGVMTLPAPGEDASLSGSSCIYVDTLCPSANRVISDIPAGTYQEGSVIPIVIEMTEPVIVTPGDGRMALLLNCGSTGNAAYAYYETGSGTDRLIFSYVVRDGDGADPLDVYSNSLVLGNWSMADSVGNEVTTTLYASGESGCLSENVYIVVGSGYPTTPTGAEDVFEAGSSTTGMVPVSRSLTDLHSGIGDGDDLLVNIKPSVDGKWYPLIHSGWYYLGEVERYLFTDKERKVFNVPVGPGTVSVSSNVDHPDCPEPIIVKYMSGVPFTRVFCSPYIEELSSWTLLAGTTDKWQMQLTRYPLELYRDSFTYPMSKVCVGVSDTLVDNYFAIVDDTQYTLETEPGTASVAYTVTVAATGTPTVYAMILPTTSSRVSDGLDSLLKQTEVGVVDSYGNVRTMYETPSLTPPYDVMVYTMENGVVTSATASADCVGNLIDVTGLGIGAAPGDRVAMTYYVDDSYVVNTNNGILYLLGTIGGSATLDYEYSNEEWWLGASDASGGNTELQFNPIYSGISSGFLYVEEDTGQIPDNYSITMDVAPKVVSVTAGTGPPVRIRLRAFDSDSNPVKGLPIAIGASGQGSLGAPIPGTGLTDWRGEVVYTWTPTASGTTTLTASASSVSATGAIHQYSLTEYSSRETYAEARKVYLHIDSSAVKDGRAPVTVFATTCDGLCPIKGQVVSLRSLKSKFTCANNSVTTDKDGVAKTTYYWVDDDRLVAFASTGSGRRIYSNIIHVGRG